MYIEDRNTYIEIQFKNVNKNVGNDVDGRVHERQIIIMNKLTHILGTSQTIL